MDYAKVANGSRISAARWLILARSKALAASDFCDCQLATQLHPVRVTSEAANPSWQIGLVRTSQEPKRTAINAMLNHSRRFIPAPPPPPSIA
jgi:hypothetical protein